MGPIQVMRQRGVGLRAGGQQFTDARHAIRAGQHGPIVAPAHALEDGFEIGLQADHRAARGQRLTVGWIDHSAAARGDHEAGRRGHLTANRGFQRPESRLAILREDLRDGFARALHDQIVQVNERTSQPCRHFAADSGLAGAHEAGQDDIGWRVVGHNAAAEVAVLAFGNRCRTCVRTRRAIFTARSASASETGS